MPIGAYEPRWFMRYVHMNPEEAVAAFPRVACPRDVPIHWGTFKLTDEAMTNRRSARVPHGRGRLAVQRVSPARAWRDAHSLDKDSGGW